MLIMAVTESSRITVPVMVMLSSLQVENRGYCSAALALLYQSTSQVV